MTNSSLRITSLKSYRQASLVFGLLVLLPWLIVSDYFFVGLPAGFIVRLVVVLFLGNILWALLIQMGMKPIKKYLC